MLNLHVDPLGGAAESELAQGGEVGFAEEGVGGRGDLLRNVDLAGAEAVEEGVGREVDEFDLVGLFDDCVRDGLADTDAGDLRDDVVERLDVLDVERAVDVDAGVEAGSHVLPAFFVLNARSVGVGELVDHQQLGFASEGGVQVEFAEVCSAVGDGFA
ncbi:MAG: hypothetical protein QM783_07460 [Phycisphaerales bacterium]